MDKEEKIVRVMEKLIDIANQYLDDYCAINDRWILSDEEIKDIEDEEEREILRELKDNNEFLEKASAFLENYKSSIKEKQSFPKSHRNIGYELYEHLTPIQKNHLADFEIIFSIETISDKKLIQQEKDDLLDIIKAVWFKDEEHTSLSWIADQISKAYCDEKVSLKTLKNADCRDILLCVLDLNDFENLEDEMKREYPHVQADRKFIIDLIKVGAIDDLDEFKKMTDQEQESAIDYWVEHYYDDYSRQELKELGLLDNEDIEENEL